jgi:hypothetical protein
VKVPLWLGSKNTLATQPVNHVTPEQLAAVNKQEATSVDTHTASMPSVPISEPVKNEPTKLVAHDPTISDSQPLEDALKQAGFENIQVAIIDRQLTVALENNLYNWNELDGVGVALGLMATHAPDQVQDLQLILLNQKLPVLSVSGSRACTKVYLQQSGHCDSGKPLFDVSTRNLDQQLAKLKSQPQTNSSSFRPRLVVAPALYWLF